MWMTNVKSQNYRPVSLTSVVGKNGQGMINNSQNDLVHGRSCHVYICLKQ